MDLIRLFEQKRNYHTALNIIQMAIEKNPENAILALKRENLLARTIPVT
jgi:antitoxin component HigA of HigAB toxin-antitoxin module